MWHDVRGDEAREAFLWERPSFWSLKSIPPVCRNTYYRDERRGRAVYGGCVSSGERIIISHRLMWGWCQARLSPLQLVLIRLRVLISTKIYWDLSNPLPGTRERTPPRDAVKSFKSVSYCLNSLIEEYSSRSTYLIHLVLQWHLNVPVNDTKQCTKIRANYTCNKRNI